MYARAIAPAPAVSIAMRMRPWLMVATSFPLVDPAGTGGCVSAHRSTLGAIGLVPVGCGVPQLVATITPTTRATNRDPRSIGRQDRVLAPVAASRPYSRRNVIECRPCQRPCQSSARMALHNLRLEAKERAGRSSDPR